MAALDRSIRKGETVVLNNQEGPADLVFEDRELRRKQITTDGSRFAIPAVSAGTAKSVSRAAATAIAPARRRRSGRTCRVGEDGRVEDEGVFENEGTFGAGG